jgi:hypothetical protein
MEKSDKRITNESALWYKVKCMLNKRGYDLVKKEPAKDGHLTGAPYYLRDRKDKFCFHDEMYMIRNIAKDFNHNGKVELRKLS